MSFRLKFGILLTSIWATSHSKQRAICEALFHAINEDYQVDDNCANRSKGCLRNIPAEIVENIRNVSTSSIKRDLGKNVSSLIINPKGLIEYLIMLLKNDDSINGDMKIGFQDSITKKEYLAKNVFNLDEVLTDFLVFTVIRNENQDDEMHEWVSNRKKTTIFRKISELQTNSAFKLISNNEGDISNLPSTIESESFDNIFTEVANGHINIPNPNNIHAYLLNTNIYNFDYSDLTDFVMENMCNYVYSRQELRSSSQNNTAIRKSVLRASQKLRDQANEDQLGQILIYVFLEKVLGAPKLMTKIEMGGKSINGDGLFLNSLGPGKYQIVIGSSRLFDDAVEAIDEIIEQIDRMDQNGGFNVNNLILDINFQSYFSTNELQNLRSILIPKKGYHLRTNAFGLFIGYTLHADSTLLNMLNEDDAENRIKASIQNDLEMVIKRLNTKISEANLQHYSFYVYMMPFTNVKIDSDHIMYEVRGGAR